MNKTVEEINEYLSNNGWEGRLLIPYIDAYEQKEWNKHATMKEGYKWFAERRERLFQSVKEEFQARHSAFSYEAAKAYGDNWN